MRPLKKNTFYFILWLFCLLCDFHTFHPMGQTAGTVGRMFDLTAVH